MSKKTTKKTAPKAATKAGKPGRKPVWTNPKAVVRYNESTDVKSISGLTAAIRAARGCTEAEAHSIIAETACNRLSALLKYAS